MFTTDKFQDFDIMEFEVLDSTQEEAKRVIRTKADTSIIPNNIVITAGSQTSGRGRSGREWISHDGNLFFSVIIDSKRINPPEITSYIAGLSVFNAISEILKNNIITKVKWPNDILIDGKKICGILIEKFGDHIITGIGVNITSAPEYLDSNRKACALSEHTKDIDAKRLLRNILANFQNIISENSKNSFEDIRQKYKNNLYRLNEEIELDYLGRKTKGFIRDISPSGSLIIEDKNGLQEYRVGEIFDI